MDEMLRLWHDGITGGLPVISADLCDWCASVLGRSVPVNPRGDKLAQRSHARPARRPVPQADGRAAGSGPEPAAYRAGRRHVHDPGHGRGHRREVHADRHARAPGRRTAAAPARLRGDVHGAGRRDPGDLPRAAARCPRRGDHQRAGQRPARVHQRRRYAVAAAVLVLARQARRSSSPWSASPSPPGRRRRRRSTPPRGRPSSPSRGRSRPEFKTELLPPPGAK